MLISMGWRSGGINIYTRVQQDFYDFVDIKKLRDVDLMKGKFTQTNKRKGFTTITDKLDRFLLFGNWLEEGDQCVASILPFNGSDHFLIQIVFTLENYNGGSPFKFEKKWTRDPTLHDLIT